MTAPRAWLVLLALPACGGPCPDGAQVVTVGPLEICAEVARTEAERRRGLVGRSSLAENEGLLLDFPLPDEICIVNAGVAFGIDAVFVDPRGRVTRVERAIPPDDATARCAPETQRVLEVAAGVAEAVQPGDPLQLDER